MTTAPKRSLCSIQPWPPLLSKVKFIVLWWTNREISALMRYPFASLALFPRLFRARQPQLPSYLLSGTFCPQSRLRPLQISRGHHNEFITQSHNEKRTIYALSTPPGRAGVAVIRISGPNALDVHHSMVTASSSTPPGHKERAAEPEPWRMERCSIRDVQTQETLDDGLTVFFKGMAQSSDSLSRLFPVLCPFCFHRAKIVHIGRYP